MIKKCAILTFIISLSFLIYCSQTEKSITTTVPEWAKSVVWYQIFPERFWNGDPSNDPTLETLVGSWPFDTTSEWQLSPWTSDWYKLQPWEQDGRGFYLHAQRRRYGGDLQGIIDKLDYLEDLGINAIYLNPVFESPSLHKYDGASYHHIEDNFGPDPEGDRKLIALENPMDPATWKTTSADSLFFQLLNKCHQRDIRVIIDGVWNHVGLNFWAFQDVEKNQQQSQFSDWFTIKSWDDPATQENEFDYQGWANVKQLPELFEGEDGFVPGAWEYMQNAIKKWMDPNGDGDPSDGIDGWRLDVAAEVGFPAWRKFRQHVRSINPQAYITGEIWWDEWPKKMLNAAPWLQGDTFDAVMNYRFARNVIRFFVNKNKKLTVTEFDSIFHQIEKEYPQDNLHVMQNLVDSHDTDRIASMIINPDRIYGYQNQVQHNQDYLVRKPYEDERQIQKLITLFQLTFIGAPMIYYGDEAGMWGASDPDERKPMLWPMLEYDDEVSHPFDKIRPYDTNEFDYDLFEYYKKCVHMRRNEPALMFGSFTTKMVENEQDVYAFQRKYNNEKIVIILNNSKNSQAITLEMDEAEWVDLMTGKFYQSDNGILQVNILGKQGLVLKWKN